MEEDTKEKDLPVTTSGTEASASGRRRRKMPRKATYIIIAVVVIAALAGAGWFLFTKPDFEQEVTTQPTPTPSRSTPTPTVSEEKFERSEISINVLNGSGIPGAAGDLQEDLEDIGYTDIEVGNADDQDYEDTQIVFDENVPEQARDEIIDLLRDFFATVDDSEDELNDFDVEIITGYPIGFTPTPTKEPEPTSTPTPTATDSATPTP
jgi:hypothetical protein